MGKGSSSTQSSSNQSTQVDRKITQGEESVAFVLDESSQLDLTTPEAWGLAAQSLSLVNEGGHRMLESVERTISANQVLTKELLKRNQSETGQRLEDLIKYGAAVGAIGLVVLAIKKGKK